MISRDDILSVLRTIDDPEMPISIVDLGLVEHIKIDDHRVGVSILPTFVGCPALSMIHEEIERKLSELEGVEHVDVEFVNDPPWSVDRITEAGREALASHGVTVPQRGDGRALKLAGQQGGGVTVTTLRTSAILCPFCGSADTRLDSPFGPTRCRMIYYCDACSNSFEHMKRVE